MKYIYTCFRVMYEVEERFNSIFPHLLFYFSKAGMAFQGAAIHRKDEPGDSGAIEPLQGGYLRQPAWLHQGQVLLDQLSGLSVMK